ncbi:MAG: hypothetical protein JO137_14220 [Hyphomicrobiales bacterium]|nr:hypothetical protein [Hyphomicrobiales bacterium]
MKGARKASIPPPEAAASPKREAPNEQTAGLAEAWKSAMGPWLSWYGALDSTLRSRATPLAQAAGKLWTQPDRMAENLGLLSEGFRQMAGFPELADMPDIGLKSLPSLEPAMELMAVLQQYLRVATPIWIEACQRFENEALRRRGEGESFDSASDALELWNNTLDRTLMEFNRSSEFAQLQQRYLRAAIHQRSETRRYFAQLAKAVDGPTRPELDDIYRRLHELRREVVALRHRADEPSTARDSGRPIRKAAPASRPVARKSNGKRKLQRGSARR